MTSNHRGWDKKPLMRAALCGVGALLTLLLLGCGNSLVKTDLATLQENPQDYAGKNVIITADIKSLLNNPRSYLYRKVETSGYVEYRESRVGHYWNFTLMDEEGNMLTCYERRYGKDVWIWPVSAVRDAAQKNNRLIVMGKFQKGRTIELDWIEYEGRRIDTDFLPPASPRIYR